MPIVTVHEDSDLRRGEHQIGTAGKLGAMLAETQSSRMRKSANSELALRINASDARHHVAALCAGKVVCHES